VTIPATVPQRSEIPEGLTHYPVYVIVPPSTFCSYIDVYWHACTFSSCSTEGISVVVNKILSHEAVS
jgi:hypothetical protein